MKTKILILGIIILTSVILAYTNRTEIYRFGKKIIKTFTKETEINDGKSIWGIDISHHQQKINWEDLVKYNKPDFMFLKATEGVTHQDTKYQTYKKKAQEYDILSGAYHFFSYKTSGKAQAENFINFSKLNKGDLIPVLDLEYVKNRKSYRSKLGEIKEFCEIIKSEYGVNPIIYCECDYKQKVLDSYFDDFVFWISSMDIKPFCNYTIWQYTDKGNVKGIGKIDNNKLHPNSILTDLILSE